MPEPAMADPISHVKNISLYDLKAASQHCLHTARKNGEETHTPLAFMGAVTVAIGGQMLWNAWRQYSRHQASRNR